MDNLLSATEERVYFKDRHSRFLFVSEGWIDAVTPGRDLVEILGKTDFDVFSEEHAAAAFEDEQEIIRTGRTDSRQAGARDLPGPSRPVGLDHEDAASRRER